MLPLMDQQESLISKIPIYYSPHRNYQMLLPTNVNSVALYMMH